eukprot:Gregarina_sp_Poly_1__7654@NODE_42_length_18083_cov_98_634880_g36_i0_p7_GENE_NODE_42_length_18083_cov_98_634880_g36_i0NODE_42_length_18083_cov_98_634880_g36_i0_p7_ORF_typecomplete_len428_score94_95BSD/PF03909_17/9_9e05DUF883/PF05957_13/0_019DUF883/PF05957_13/1_8e04DUF711/PF05167_12/0_017DUF2570/PF10828_8/38DUF2570/PF10828_8/1_3e04DUF2570/PF10828_8/2_4_NODE_42_length_18083_cov_98_634880_g36_i0895510238
MQNLFRSFVETLSTAPGSNFVSAAEDSNAVPSEQEPPYLIDGQEYVSVPTGQDDDLSLTHTLTQVSQNLNALTSPGGIQSLQEKLRQNPQFNAVAAKLSQAATQLQETAREMARDMNKELSSRWPGGGDTSFDPESPEFRDHPLRYLPWEQVAARWPQLVGPELYTEEQIVRAIQDVVCMVTKDPEFLSLPPPPHYKFVMDKPRQRLAFEIVKLDRHLGHVRFQIVPRRYREEEFWLVYFWRLETLLETFPQGFMSRLASVKQEDAQAEQQQINRERRLSELLKEERAALGTLPVSVIPEFLNPTRIQEFISSKAAGLQQTISALAPNEGRRFETPQETPIPEAQANGIPKAAPAPGVATRQLAAAADPAATTEKAVAETSPVGLEPAKRSSEAESGLFNVWTSPASGADIQVDVDDLDEFEKQLLG